MYYEINVALHGAHFFATAERSITNEVKAKMVHKALQEKFKESEGYKITVTRYEHAGYSVDWAPFM